MNLISFDVHIIPESGSEPVVITLPPDAALGVVAYSSANVVKLVPNYGLPTVPFNPDQE